MRDVWNGWNRQGSALLVWYCLIELSVFLHWLEDALLYLLHLFAVDLLWLLSHVVLLDWLHVIVSANSCVFVKELPLGVVRLPHLSRTLRKLYFLPLFFGHEVIGNHKSLLCPSGCLLLLRLIESISSRVVKDRVAGYSKLVFLFLRFLLPQAFAYTLSVAISSKNLSAFCWIEIHSGRYVPQWQLVPYRRLIYPVSVAVDLSQWNIWD